MDIQSIIGKQGIDNLADAVRDMAQGRALDWVTAVCHYELAQECLTEIESLGANADGWLLDAKTEYDRLVALRQTASKRADGIKRQMKQFEGNRPQPALGSEGVFEGTVRLRAESDEREKLNVDFNAAAGEVQHLSERIAESEWHKLEQEVEKLQAVPKPIIPPSLLAEFQKARSR